MRAVCHNFANSTFVRYRWLMAETEQGRTLPHWCFNSYKISTQPAYVKETCWANTVSTTLHESEGRCDLFKNINSKELLTWHTSIYILSFSIAVVCCLLLQFFQLSIFFTWSISGFTKGDLIRRMWYTRPVEACGMARRYGLYFNICILYYSQMVVPFKPKGDHTFNSCLQLCLYIFVSITAAHVTAHIGLCRICRNRLINSTIFGNRRIDTKCVLIFCTYFIRNFFISWRITVNVHRSSSKMPDILY